MRFVDVVNIVVRSGNAGNTIVRFRKQKSGYYRSFINYGGDGGHVWLITDCNLNTLSYFSSSRRVFFAENGQNGWGRGCRGRSGRDIYIRVPVGTRVYDRSSNKIIGDLHCNGDKLMLVKGGVHASFCSRAFCAARQFSGNKSLMNGVSQVIYGFYGKQRDIKLELLLLADVGVLGLPNVGKSTFVRAVSAAKPKVADYPFTTLVPYLGVVYVNSNCFVIADIPGLIKGASIGKGLGISFLKHLQHCRMLLHIIDVAPIEYSDILNNIRVVISELQSYSIELVCKPIWLIFNKIDLLNINELDTKIKYIVSALGWRDKYYLISSKKKYGLKALCHDLMKFINNNK